MFCIVCRVSSALRLGELPARQAVTRAMLQLALLQPLSHARQPHPEPLAFVCVLCKGLNGSYQKQPAVRLATLSGQRC